MDKIFYSYEGVQEIANDLLGKTSIRPKIGIICGSGLSSIGNCLTKCQKFPYKNIRNFPVSTVEGHAGQLLFGNIGNVPVVCMQGRFHYYEGYPLSVCSLPVRVMKLLGITHLIITNAAGGVNPNFKVGDIMLIKDHINMMGIAGNCPLQGLNDNRFGPRFPSMTNAYDKSLIATAMEIATSLGFENSIRQGVFTCVGGPNYETVAEARMLRVIGVDAVGMSTVHEAITAIHCGLKIFAFSLITNICNTEYDTEQNIANHEEVVNVGLTRQKICEQLVCGLINRIEDEII